MIKLRDTMERVHELRILGSGDEDRLRSFLERHAASSMFLRANLEMEGIVDHGRPRQATYAARVTDGEVEAVVAHAWNGNLIFQAPMAGVELARLAARGSRRLVRGLLGPWSQIDPARHALGLGTVPTGMNSHEDLHALSLEALRVPEALGSGAVQCRRALPEELEALALMRRDFKVEGLRELPTEALLEECRREIGRQAADGALFSLLDASRRLVSTCCYNAALPDCVQIGGVWTPPEHRGQGYAGAVVAGALLQAKGEGRSQALLFTGKINHPAQSVYRRLGFRIVGEYGLIFFRDGHALAAPAP